METARSDVYAPSQVREELVRAHAHTWRNLGRPGTWLTGAERAAIAAETRAAQACALCRERRKALSPYALDGTHDAAGEFDAARADAVHCIVADPGRLSRRLVDDLAESGVGDAQYVELLSVVVFTMAVDAFHRTLGIALLPLPQPEEGEPCRERPSHLDDIGAWVPVLSTKSPIARELFADAMRVSNVARALSLVPDATRDQIVLIQAQYVSLAQIAAVAESGRALTRAQMELIATRVSALNECFY